MVGVFIEAQRALGHGGRAAEEEVGKGLGGEAAVKSELGVDAVAGDAIGEAVAVFAAELGLVATANPGEGVGALIGAAVDGDEVVLGEVPVAVDGAPVERYELEASGFRGAAIDLDAKVGEANAVTGANGQRAAVDLGLIAGELAGAKEAGGNGPGVLALDIPAIEAVFGVEDGEAGGVGLEAFAGE